MLRGGGGGWEGPEVSADEVRSAAGFHTFQGPPPNGDNAYAYPPSIHSAMLSPSPSHAPPSPHPNGNLPPSVLCFSPTGLHIIVLFPFRFFTN